MTRPALRAVGLIAAVQTILRIGPLIIQAIGGRGLPTPGSFNDPAHALAIIRQSPEVMIVAGLIFGTGTSRADTHRFPTRPHRHHRSATTSRRNRQPGPCHPLDSRLRHRATP